MRAWTWLTAALVFACQQGGSGPARQGGSGADAGVSPPEDAADAGQHVSVGRPGWPAARAGYLNPIPGENQKPGEDGWNRGFGRAPPGQLEGYADRVSARAGDAVNLMLRSARPGRAVSWALLRIGWYGGSGARVLATGTTTASPQAACPPDPVTGLVRCSWSPTLTVPVPADAVSGLYVVRILDEHERIGILVPLVVIDDRPADLLMSSAVLTAQAYNAWGGTGLYDPPGAFAVQVSFDRPYDSDLGSGQMLRYEAPMARFLERSGYDVAYTTNLDVARQGAAGLLKRGAYLSVGHDEYWPGEQRDAVEAARDSGVPILFFGANAAYWKVRLSNPGADGNARVVTCYKQKPEKDPLAASPQRTGRYRDDGVRRPEEQLVGTMYESWMFFGQPWVVLDDAHPVYEGTGLRAGDSIPELVGYEYDRTTGAQTPSPVEVIARSPLIDAEGRPGLSEATVYRTPGGALVFGAGTIFWSKALDGRQRDARVERMTANVLRLALDLPVPPALASVTAPAAAAPMGQWAAAVRTLASGMPGPAGVAQLPDGTFVIADARANRIWQADGSGKFWPYAGDGHPSPSSFFDNVPGLSARFFGPTAVLPDAAGNVYVADTHNTAIRKIANDPARTVTTFAGALMRAGNADGVGAAARFGSPMGMAWLDGAHIVIADAANMSIRVLDVNSRAVTTLATAHSFEETDGPAARATLYSPTAVAVGPDGRVYFVASQTGTVKMIAPDGSRTITTLVAGGHGFADGPGTEARLEPQMGLAWFNGGLIVSDPGNARLRWVSPGGSAATTSVRTWAGSGASVTADGDGASASFQLPLGLWRGQDGKVYVVDGAAGALRVVDP